MYLERLLFTFPRTSLRNRWRSCSIFCPTAIVPRGGVGAARRARVTPASAAYKNRTKDARVKRSLTGVRWSSGQVRAGHNQKNRRAKEERETHRKERQPFGPQKRRSQSRAAFREPLAPRVEVLVTECDKSAEDEANEPRRDSDPQRREATEAEAERGPGGEPDQRNDDGERFIEGHGRFAKSAPRNALRRALRLCFRRGDLFGREEPHSKTNVKAALRRRGVRQKEVEFEILPDRNNARVLAVFHRAGARGSRFLALRFGFRQQVRQRVIKGLPEPGHL